MITKLRSQSKRILNPIARSIAKNGISANFLTTLGLALSAVYAIVIFITRNALLGVLVIVMSSFMDALDGEVARVKGEASQFGAFLDSSFDRLEDTLFISPLVFLGFNSFLVATLIGFSLTISYLRAKAELAGLKMEGRGIVERGERIILTALTLLVYFFNHDVSLVLFYVFYVLSLVTVIQRFYAVLSSKDKL